MHICTTEKTNGRKSTASSTMRRARAHKVALPAAYAARSALLYFSYIYIHRPSASFAGVTAGYSRDNRTGALRARICAAARLTGLEISRLQSPAYPRPSRSLLIRFTTSDPACICNARHCHSHSDGVKWRVRAGNCTRVDRRSLLRPLKP